MDGGATLQPGAGDHAAVSLIGGLLAARQADPRALWTSFSMIVVSEIGDKTFLIAAILAMRQPRLIVFGGAFGALALMSVLSAVMGVLLPTLLPRALTTLMAAALFVVFGVRMLREGMHMTGDEISEEWEEAKREVEREEATSIGGDHVELGSLEEGAGRANEHASSPRMNGRGSPPASPSAKRSSSPRGFFALDAATLKDGARNLCGLCFSPIFAHAFVLTFLGEWGDRSQIATIALAAAHNIALVSIGTIAGHALCTGVAVLAGRWVATRISVKHVMLTGAVLFLIFGLLYGVESLQEMLSSGISSEGRSAFSDAATKARLAAMKKESAPAASAVYGAGPGPAGGVIYEGQLDRGGAAGDVAKDNLHGVAFEKAPLAGVDVAAAAAAAAAPAVAPAHGVRQGGGPAVEQLRRAVLDIADAAASST